MKTAQKLLGFAALTFACSMLGTGCSAGNDPASEVTPAAATAQETLSVDLDDGVAHVTKLSPEEMHVDILSRDGGLRFSVDLRPGEEGESNVAWKLHNYIAAAPEAKDIDSGALSVPFEQSPTMEEGARLAAIMEHKIKGGMSGKEYDSWGCDLPFQTVSSCSPWGGCCDTHDACYAKNHCSSSSWYKPWPWTSAACVACNAKVVSCFNRIIPPGRSACCSKGNCGKPR